MSYTEIGKCRVKLLPDVHLGRRFLNGVPLHRRGERERLLFDHFKQEITNPGDVQYVIQVGDIFDRMVIPNRLLLETTRVITQAVQDNPGTTFIFMRGNHDASRDADVTSSFEVLEALLEDYEEVDFVSELTTFHRTDESGGFLCVPWHPFKSSSELLEPWQNRGLKLHAVLGHWDVEDYGGDGDNMVPYESLAGVTDRVITGHDHIAKDFEKDGIKVEVTGSLQPLTHGEDPHDLYYVTMSADEYAHIQPEDYVNKYVRVVIGPGEPVPEPIDCLGFTIKRVGAQGEDELDVSFESFDVEDLFRETFQEQDCDQRVTDAYWGQYKEMRNA